MTRFRDLLKFDPDSHPRDEQRRASEGLATAVAGSHFHWWKDREVTSLQGQCLVLAVAPFSQYDLLLLDLLDEQLDSGPSPMLVYVANLLDYASVKELGVDFPGVAQAPQTPIAALYQSGLPKRVASGKKARDMAAETLGLSAEELAQRVATETPSYTKVRVPSTTPLSPRKDTMSGPMTDEQRRFLWQCYREEQERGGPARDHLPYTDHFENIRTRFNERFGTTFDQHEIWSSLSDLDKNADRRRQIGCVA
jgi:hypothetical protein